MEKVKFQVNILIHGMNLLQNLFVGDEKKIGRNEHGAARCLKMLCNTRKFQYRL